MQNRTTIIFCPKIFSIFPIVFEICQKNSKHPPNLAPKWDFRVALFFGLYTFSRPHTKYLAFMIKCTIFMNSRLSASTYYNFMQQLYILCTWVKPLFFINSDNYEYLETTKNFQMSSFPVGLEHICCHFSRFLNTQISRILCSFLYEITSTSQIIISIVR